MDDKKIRIALHDALETKIPSTSVHLWPLVKASFTAGNIQQGKKMKPTQRRITFAAMAMVVLLIIVLVTPQGRAFAQLVIQFFPITDQKSFPIPTEQVLPIPQTPTPPAAKILPLEAVAASQTTPTTIPDADCSSPTSSNSYACQVKAAEAGAGFNAREFPDDPKGMKFSSAAYLPSTGEINMEFVANTGGGYLYLRQGIYDFQAQVNDWGKVPADAVERVTVNGQYAEFVSGGFVAYPNATEAVWEPGGWLRLAWRDGSRWLILEKRGDPYPIEWITKEQLIQLAEGLVDNRAGNTVPPLDPENLSTIEQAEALAGFNIPAPALLPAGYELKRVVWANNVARLMYGPQESSQSALFIFMGQITSDNAVGPCSDCPPDVIETTQIGPWQGWYWRGIYETFTPPENGQPTPSPVWRGNAAHWSLAWNSDTLWFSMFYSPADSSGIETNKEMLVKIAESLK
jgi:hypothetical protein